MTSIGELVDGLWGEQAPATGEAVIRTYVSRIRRLLAAHGLDSAISSQSGGYMLDPSLFALDATEFADLLETARQERVNGDLPAAVKLLEQALGLWTGTALSGVRYISSAGEEDVRSVGATPADHDELVTMAREIHGEFTAASVRFWLDRQPRAFSLLRCRRSNRLRAFMSWLTLRTPDREELEADPVVGDVWYDVSRRMAMPPGAHVAVARHLICPAFEAGPSPVMDVFQARMMRGWLHEPSLAASYLVVANGQLWRPLMEYLGHYELEYGQAEHPHAIFGHDWLADPPEEWRDHHLDEELWAGRGLDLFLRRDTSGADAHRAWEKEDRDQNPCAGF
ncbi:hypothetical protein GCM10010517_02860 [Streptosporangium fragile]|uniref:Bacterial transcriptional activator domain-containing protein n=1 Tax=Streptosporangium fragile TaxID=46186 RepID=A0ABP6I589_9ACTN